MRLGDYRPNVVGADRKERGVGVKENKNKNKNKNNLFVHTLS